MLRATTARQAERGLLGFFACLLLWAPLPLASNRPWALAWLAALSALLCAGACVLRALRDDEAGTPAPLWAAGPVVLLPLSLLVGFMAWVAAHGGESADGFSTRLYIVRCVLCVSLFAAVAVLASSPRRRQAVLAAVFAAGVAQALLAITLFSSGAHYELLGFPFHQGLRATGTFANADHLAQYMALCLSAGVGLLLMQMRPPQDAMPGWKGWLMGLVEFVMSTKMLVRLMLVVMVITLVLTRSRMGNGAFFIAVLLLGLWVMARSPRLRKGAAILVLSLLVVDVVVVGQWVGLEKVVQRMRATELAAAAEAASGVPQPQDLLKPRVYREETLEERLYAAADALILVQRQPVQGFGGGAFYAVFPEVKRAGLGLYDHAHNDYVEIAVDTGLVGLGLLVALFLLTLWRVARLMSDSQGTQARGLAAGVGMAMICALLHGLVDFNLQIPANAMTLTVLLAVAWSQPLGRGRSARELPQKMSR